jgi:hypothetical protein
MGSVHFEAMNLVVLPNSRYNLVRLIVTLIPIGRSFSHMEMGIPNKYCMSFFHLAHLLFIQDINLTVFGVLLEL